MLDDLRALGETMGAFRSGQMLKYQVLKKWGTVWKNACENVLVVVAPPGYASQTSTPALHL